MVSSLLKMGSSLLKMGSSLLKMDSSLLKMDSSLLKMDSSLLNVHNLTFLKWVLVYLKWNTLRPYVLYIKFIINNIYSFYVFNFIFNKSYLGMALGNKPNNSSNLTRHIFF